MKMNSLNQVIIEGYVSHLRNDNGGVSFCLSNKKRAFRNVPCIAVGKGAGRLSDWHENKLPVRIVGRIDFSESKNGQFSVFVEHAEPLLDFALTPKGHEAAMKNGGKIIIQVIEAGGIYDYTEYGSMARVLEELEKEVPFEDWLEFRDEGLHKDYDSFVNEQVLSTVRDVRSADVSAECERFRKDYPFERYLSARKDDLMDSWGKELSDSVGEYDLNDLMMQGDPSGFGAKFGYLQEIERDGPKINQVIIEGTAGNVRERLSGDHKDFFITGRRIGRPDFTVRCSVSSGVDPAGLCRDGSGIRIVGRIHGCSIPEPDGSARQGFEVLAKHIDRSPLHDVVKQQAVSRDDDGWGY